jgi:hypothetical protein
MNSIIEVEMYIVKSGTGYVLDIETLMMASSSMSLVCTPASSSAARYWRVGWMQSLG